MSKEISLTTGEKTIVDDKDYNFLINFSKYWRLNGRYVLCVKNGGVVRMHRLLLDPKNEEIVDHINHNTLDNRRENLRITNKSGNTRNSRKTSKPVTSKFKGVSYCKQTNSWKVGINVKGTGKIHIGYFTNEVAGALAYNEYAKKYFGEFACINNIENNDRDIDFKKYKLVRNFSSKYRGVTFNKNKNKWETQIYINKVIKRLGAFKTEEEAYKAIKKFVLESDNENLKKKYISK